MEGQTLLEYASQQVLNDALGFDEAQIYFYILTKKELILEKEYSYSKRYRVMKRLFELGAVGKFKPQEKDTFNYFILPPSFLLLNETDSEVVNYLEELYYKNHSDVFRKNLNQILIKDERPILIFLLRYFMKKSANIVTNDKDIKKLFRDNSDNVYFEENEDKIKSGTIDQQIFYQFVKIPALKETEYIGYMSYTTQIKHR